MRVKSVFYYETTIGRVGIVEEAGSVTHVLFEQDVRLDDAREEETPLLREASKQIQEYLDGERQQFDLPLNPCGTPFRQQVWKGLCAIPYGESRSYQDLARWIGNDKACRAVGNANNKNPIPLIIPCHRVIGANGKLTGYRGGLERKKQLLDLENITYQN